MDSKPRLPQLEPLNVPFYTGNSLIQAMAYMDQVMQVFRKRRTFTSSQDSSSPNFVLQPYHQSLPQDLSQNAPSVDIAHISQNSVENHQNAQISERAKRAQEVNEICQRDARNHALANIGLSIDGQIGQNSTQQTQQTQQTHQSIQQNQPNQESNQNIQETPQNSSTENSLNIQPKFNNGSIFSNPASETINLGYGNQPKSSDFTNKTSENQSLGYQAQKPQGSTSLFGSFNQGTSSINNSGFSLGYQPQGANSIFTNQTQGTPSFFGINTEQKSSIFSNQNSETSSNLCYQTQGIPSLFGNKIQEKTPQTLNKNSQKLKNSQNNTQNQSLFGYQNKPETSIIQESNSNTQESQRIVSGTGFSIISEANSQSSATAKKGIFNSTPQNTGGFFGSINPSNQPNQSSGLFSGGLFGRNTPQNQTTLGYNPSNTQTSQPDENVRPQTLGYQTSASPEKAQEKEKQVKNEIQLNKQQKVQQQRPAQQLNSGSSYNPSTITNSTQNNSSNHAGLTIFTQTPKPNNLFSNTQLPPVIVPRIQTREPEQVSTNQPHVKPTEPQQTKKVNLFATSNPIVPPINTPAQQPPVQGLFGNNQPQEQNRSGLFGNVPPQNTTANREPVIQQTTTATTTTTNFFNIATKRPQKTNQSTNLFGNATQNPPQQTSPLFSVPSNNMFSQNITPSSSPFGAFNTLNSGQNMFSGVNQGATNLFGGPRTAGGASLFGNQQKQEQNSDEEGSDAGEDDDEKQQNSKEESVQGELRYEGYNQTEIIYKLEAPAPKLKVVSTQSLKQNVKLSLEKFPESDLIYVIVRMLTKRPIYFGILTKDSSVEIFSQSKGNFAMKLEKLIQIDLTADNKKSLESWRIQLNENPNARGFFAKCQEIVNNLKETQK